MRLLKAHPLVLLPMRSRLPTFYHELKLQNLPDGVLFRFLCLFFFFFFFFTVHSVNTLVLVNHVFCAQAAINSFSIDYIPEPNIIDEVSNTSVSVKQLVQDFISLRKLLNSLGMQDSVLVGPDVTNPTPGSSAAKFLPR